MFDKFKGRGLTTDESVAEFNKDPSAKLLDVRTPEEYRSGHIPGSVNLPVDSIQKAESLLPDKNAPVYVYCLSGMRSGSAVHALGKMGYLKVKNIGGISAYHGKIER